MAINEPGSESAADSPTLTGVAEACEADSKPEVGILIIHGIGEQKRGQTIVDYADPLFRFMQRWIGEPRQEALSGNQSSPPAQAHYKVRADRAVLDGGTERDKTPPHVTVEIEGPPGTLVTRWIIAEAFWADCFPPPSSVAVSHWLMKIGPWVWISFFLRRLKMSAISIRALTRNPGAISWSKVLAEILKLSGFLIVTALLSPGVLILELLLVVLLIVGLLPIPAVRKVVHSIQAKISGVLGDCFIFDSSIIRRQAVLTKVTDDLKWLQMRCRNLVVLGHSQGGAIAYFVLKNYLPGSVRLLITFGSGLLKLFQIQKQPLIISLVSFFAIGMALVSVATFGQWLHVLWIPPTQRYLTIGFHAVYAGVLFVSCALFGMIEGTDELREWARQRSSAGLHWADLFASMDPVSNGPLFLHPDPGVESIEVHNEGFLFRSHTTYSSNVDEFYAHLISLIGKHSRTILPLGQVTARDDEIRAHARLRRRVRLFGQSVDSWALALAVVAVLLNRPLLTLVGETVSRVANGSCQTLSAIYANSANGPCWTISPTVSGAMALLFCWLVLGLVVKFIVFISALMSEEALYTRADPQKLLFPLSFYSHLFSFVALLAGIQSHSTRVFSLIRAAANLIPNRYPDSLFFWQPFLLGLSAALALTILEVSTVIAGIRRARSDAELHAAGAHG
jgi:hypothetical protein